MPLMKYAISRVDPFVFNATRLTLSVVVLGFCVLWESTRRKSTAQESSEASSDPVNRWKLFWIVAGCSFLIGAVYQLAFLLGMERTTAGNTAIIMSSGPMWTAIVAAIFLREYLHRVAWVGLTVAFAGTLAVTLSKSQVDAASAHLIGNGLILAAALAWAIGTVISRPILRKISPIQLAFIAIAGTLPIHFLFAYSELMNGLKTLADPKLLAILLFSGIFSTGIAAPMWNFGVRSLGAAHAAIYQNLVPVTALLTGWVWLAEVPYPIQMIGGTMIIAGLIWMRRVGTRLRDQIRKT